MIPWPAGGWPVIDVVTCTRVSLGNAEPVFGRVTPAAAKVMNCWSCARSEEHTSELQSLMRISYAVFCLNKKKHHHPHTPPLTHPHPPTPPPPPPPTHHPPPPPPPPPP